MGVTRDSLSGYDLSRAMISERDSKWLEVECVDCEECREWQRGRRG